MGEGPSSDAEPWALASLADCPSLVPSLDALHELVFWWRAKLPSRFSSVESASVESAHGGSTAGTRTAYTHHRQRQSRIPLNSTAVAVQTSSVPVRSPCGHAARGCTASSLRPTRPRAADPRSVTEPSRWAHAACRTPHAASRTPHAANAPAKPSGRWQAAARPTQTGGAGCLTSTCQRLPVRSTSAVQGAGRRRPTGGLSCRIHGVCPQHGRRLLCRLDYAPMRSAPPLVARRREQMNNRVNRIHGWCASRRPPRPGASGRYGRRSAVPDEFSSGAAGSAAGAQRRRPLGLHEGQYVSGSDSSASPRSSLILYWCTAVLLVQACMVGPRKEMRPSAPLELRSSGSSAKIALNLGQSLVLCCSTRDVFGSMTL